MPKSSDIAKSNGHAPKELVSLGSASLEWYILTESARHVLNAVITKNAKEQIAESNKANPDQNKISELKSKIFKIIEITRDYRNFESKTRMKELIQQYSE